MMQTRIQLLKISVAANVRCGRRTDKSNPWGFFISVDFDSKERLRIFEEDPFYIKFVEEIIKPNMAESLCSISTATRNPSRRNGEWAKRRVGDGASGRLYAR